MFELKQLSFFPTSSAFVATRLSISLCYRRRESFPNIYCKSSSTVKQRYSFPLKESQSLKKCNLHILHHPATSPSWYCGDFVVDKRRDGICIVATITVYYYSHLCIRQYIVLTVDSCDGFYNSWKWYFQDLENFIFFIPAAAGIPQQALCVLSVNYLRQLTLSLRQSAHTINTKSGHLF